jgi:ABC-type transporter Mla MlaB component
MTWMIRSGEAPTLKLEGTLSGPWVEEVRRACTDPPAAASPLRLDLSAVTFVDAAGVSLLHDLLSRDVEITTCSGFIAELLRLRGL